MTSPDTKVIKAQMEALSGFAPGPWKVSPTDDTNVITHDREMVAEIAGDYNDPDLWPIMEADTRLIAAAPDMHATSLALCDALDEAMAEIVRLRRMLDLRGTGPAERYWEGRWRDEAADNERLRGLLAEAIQWNWIDFEEAPAESSEACLPLLVDLHQRITSALAQKGGE